MPQNGKKKSVKKKIGGVVGNSKPTKLDAIETVYRSFSWRHDIKQLCAGEENVN